MIKKENIKKSYKILFQTLSLPEMKILPGQLSYLVLLSLVPFLSLLVMIMSILNLNNVSVVNFINNAFPQESSSILIDIVTGVGINNFTIIFFISTFFLVSNGMSSIIYVSNILYKKKDRIIIDKIKSIFLTLLILILFVFILLIPTFSENILNFIKKIITFNSLYDNILKIFAIIKWPLSIFVIYINIYTIYILSKGNLKNLKYINIGAVFATFGFSVAISGYSYYINTFTRFDVIYGSLSNIIVLLMWIYVLCYIFVFGIAINVTIEKINESKNKEQIIDDTSELIVVPTDEISTENVVELNKSLDEEIEINEKNEEIRDKNEEIDDNNTGYTG